MAFFDDPEHSPGALLSKLSSDTTKINSVALAVVGLIVQMTVTLTLGLTIGFISDWRLSLINLGFLPLIALTSVGSYKVQKGLEGSDQSIEIESGSILSESVNNSKTIFSYNMAVPVADMYTKLITKNDKTVLKDALCNAFLYSLSQFIVFALYGTLFYVASVFMKVDEEKGIDVSIGDEGFNTKYISNMMRAILTILFTALGVGIAQQFIGDYATAKESLYNLFKVIDHEVTIDPEKPGSINSPEAFQGKIEFRNVNFSYPTRPGQLILKNLNLTILPGESIGFVGPSGCGKSTIIQLIERFYDVDSGEILVDDVNIKEYNLTDYRKKIGLVMQEPLLFKRSLMDNIRYGRLNATDSEIYECARKVNIQHLLDKDYNKEGTESEGKDMPVSGGEKQRLAIARIFLKNPSILLMDEATSALDKENEQFVTNSVQKYFKNTTCLTVAHRLSTIEQSDRIVLMEGGEIKEMGTHEELMKLKERYYTLVNSQQTN